MRTYRTKQCLRSQTCSCCQLTAYNALKVSGHDPCDGTVQGVDESVVSLFATAAAELLADMPAEQALARALAHMTGQTSMQACDLAALQLLSQHAQTIACRLIVLHSGPSPLVIIAV